MRADSKLQFCPACQGDWLPATLMVFVVLFNFGVARGAVFTVTNTADSGAGSLRWAITNANANPGPDIINFQITGTAPFTINLLSALPIVTDPVTIDATTQPGWANSGTPVMELNGAAAGPDGVGLQLNSAFNTVLGLAINRFPSYGIILIGASNVVQGNFIGTDTTGTLARGNGGFGIWVESSGNRIGGSKAGQGNVISGGNDTGIYIFNTSSNVVQGNFIGISANGVSALGNQNAGLMINGSSWNLIGGAGGARNYISGNGTSGIFLNGAGATQNVIQGNYIGTDNSGELVIGNADDGVTVSGAPSNTISGNVISGNGTNGVFLAGAGAAGNIVAGNFIGTDAAGKLALGNHNAGVTISTANGNLIGASNVISGNLRDGIFLTGGAGGNLVQGNVIGLSAAGTNALPNGFNGISISGASSNIVGGVTFAARNLISGNADNGIGILMVTDVLNTVVGNYIGTDVTGTRAISNTLAGVRIQGCSNLIGGATAGSGNVISGNGQQGVWIVGIAGGASANVILGNLVGLGATGASALGNGNAGVYLSDGATANQIGGASSATCNVISGNGISGIYDGILLAGGSTASNVIQGNFIGTDRTGTVALGNFRDGVHIENATATQIGGSAAGAGNLISGNNAFANSSGNDGIFLSSSAQNVIQGNRIGTDVTGTLNLGNSWNGIYMEYASSNQIGGPAAGAGNLLSANGRSGIRMNNDNSWNLIQGNFIGTQADGTNALGNIWHGIDLDVNSTNNTIGGLQAGAGNRIAYAQTWSGNNYGGIRVRTGAFNNLISANAIFRNAGLGIDLGTFGVTPNVDCENGVAANAANHGQNYPVLTNVYSGTATQIRGTLDSAAGNTYILQFFSNPSGNATGYGDGQFFLGQTNLTLGASCSSNFTVVLPVSVPAGWVVTATATDPANNTSEFSAWTNVTVIPRVQSSMVNPTSRQFSVSWTNNGGSYLLQQTFNLNPPQQWFAVTNAPLLLNGFFVLTLPATNSNAFYRLLAQ